MLLRRLPGLVFYKSQPCWGHYRFLLESERWQREDLEKYQVGRLRERIREGLGQSPFLRELYGTLDESNLVQLRDLNRFPVLDRSAVAEWISRDGIDKKGLIPLRTGGTSGAPVTTTRPVRPA